MIPTRTNLGEATYVRRKRDKQAKKNFPIFFSVPLPKAAVSKISNSNVSAKLKSNLEILH